MHLMFHLFDYDVWIHSIKHVKPINKIIKITPAIRPNIIANTSTYEPYTWKNLKWINDNAIMNDLKKLFKLV